MKTIKFMLLLGIIALLVFPACKKKKDKPVEEPTPTPAPYDSVANCTKATCNMYVKVLQKCNSGYTPTVVATPTITLYLDSTNYINGINPERVLIGDSIGELNAHNIPFALCKFMTVTVKMTQGTCGWTTNIREKKVGRIYLKGCILNKYAIEI